MENTIDNQFWKNSQVDTFQMKVSGLVENLRMNLYNFILLYRGQMGEWLNLVAWNAAVGQPTEGSNPSLSTISQ